MIKKFLIVLVIIFYSLSYVFANSYEKKLKFIYNWFLVKLEKKYDLKQEIDILENINKKIKKLFDKNNNFNKPKQENIKYILWYFFRINLLKIIELKKDLWNKIIRENYLKKNKKDEVIKLNKWNNKKEIKNYLYLFYDKDIKNIFDKYSSVTNLFSKKYYNKEIIFLDNWVWFTYIIKNYKYFDNISDIWIRDLKANWIDPNRDLIFVTKNKSIWFYTNPKKVKLISDDIIKNINNKYLFLKEIKDDKIKLFNNDYDKTFTEIKNISVNLTKNLTKEEKIKVIYNYIITNLKYSQDFSINDSKIYSWVETFMNKEWVCEWYVKLMNYMLLFSWINDVEVIRWYVFDADDFPKIWHAWIKIWNYYYDPTFDDPIWVPESKKFSEYKYFKLPKDLFYTNRYDENDLPEYIKWLNLEERKNLILKNLYNLLWKYNNSNYKLLDLVKLKKNHNIDYNKKINLKNFSKILPIKEVSNFSFYDNWVKKQIKKFKYFEINDNNIENILEQLDYDLKWYYFLKWYKKDWSFKYRLWYDFEFKK